MRPHPRPATAPHAPVNELFTASNKNIQSLAKNEKGEPNRKTETRKHSGQRSGKAMARTRAERRLQPSSWSTSNVVALAPESTSEKV